MEDIKNIVLIGETGNGKSSLGNLILGTDGFEVSNDINACTKETIQKISQIEPKIGVVDTPGLQDRSGQDKVHYDQMLEIFQKIKHLHLIAIVLNFANPRFTSSIHHMIKFLCNVFPKNFAHHVAIIFTHYDHEYQMNLNKKKKKNEDPRSVQRNQFVPEIMKLISETTNEELFLAPPVYFLDSYVEDDNSKEEINQLLAFTKILEPIENIREKANLKYKSEVEQFDERIETKTEGDYIVTYKKKYKRIEYTDYNDNITYSDWEFISEDKQYQHLPTRVEYHTCYIEKEEKVKFELGEKCMTTVHPHKMEYMTSRAWICDGSKLPRGCYSVNHRFPSTIARYRCAKCDFDLCDKCIVHFIDKENGLDL